MKAKEWAVKAKENIGCFLNEYIQETLALVKARGGSTIALAGVIKEQTQKFEAILRLCPELDRVSLFYDVLESEAPSEWKRYQTYYWEQVRRKSRRRISQKMKGKIAEARREADPVLRLAMIYAAMVDRQLEEAELNDNG